MRNNTVFIFDNESFVLFLVFSVGIYSNSFWPLYLTPTSNTNKTFYWFVFVYNIFMVMIKYLNYLEESERRSLAWHSANHLFCLTQPYLEHCPCSCTAGETTCHTGKGGRRGTLPILLPCGGGSTVRVLQWNTRDCRTIRPSLHLVASPGRRNGITSHNHYMWMCLLRPHLDKRNRKECNFEKNEDRKTYFLLKVMTRPYYLLIYLLVISNY